MLVGTVSIEKSERLANMLGKRGVKHEVLNAKQHKREAEIVAQAGRKNAVTIATNMAGRGTDIMYWAAIPKRWLGHNCKTSTPTRLEVPQEEWDQLVAQSRPSRKDERAGRRSQRQSEACTSSALNAMIHDASTSSSAVVAAGKATPAAVDSSYRWKTI